MQGNTDPRKQSSAKEINLKSHKKHNDMPTKAYATN